MTSRLHAPAPDVGLLVLRAVVGVVFVAHGSQKLFGAFGGAGLDGTSRFFDGLGIPAPDVMAPVVGVVELLGGLLLVSGSATLLAGVVLAGTMAVAILTAHLDQGFFAQEGGYEFPLTLLVASLALAATGAGRYSLDAALGLGTRRRSAA